MKAKSVTAGFILILGAMLFASPQAANADGCSAEDPCQTYAVVDSSGLVINTIVCQPSVCGSGTLGGQKVVAQVAANSVTHTTEGTSGFNSRPENGTTTYESNGTFFVQNNSAKVQTEVIYNQQDNSVTTATVTLSNAPVQTFTYADTVGKLHGEIPMQSIPLPLDTSAGIKVEEVINNTETTTASAYLSSRMTKDQATSVINSSVTTSGQTRAMNRSYARIMRMLDIWFL